MRLSVHHLTRFEFDQPSRHSIHDVRLTPKPATGQRIVGSGANLVRPGDVVKEVQ